MCTASDSNKYQLMPTARVTICVTPIALYTMLDAESDDGDGRPSTVVLKLRWFKFNKSKCLQQRELWCMASFVV